MNKNIKYLVAVLVLTMLVSSASAVTFAWSDVGSLVADDSTPDIPFKIVGNMTHYECNLYLNLSGTWTAVSGGNVTVANNVLTSVPCTYTLDPWTTYQYNITAYNSTDEPTLFTSSTYTVRYSSFSMLATMVMDISTIFTAMIALVVAIIIIMVVLAIAGGLVVGFGSMIDMISGFLRFKK